ncbi:flavin reductase family protein [Clostridium sp. AL.422]|uniref:flavin reductase n=1 Tax=Clostridium TaxID=1485 RepID=UPI00293DE77E|nr:MULTISPECIES: flavin reductase [unclassified Clostridium]MDV4151001.1 flavin reductase family protein [Clostridium sp. AL.422]
MSNYKEIKPENLDQSAFKLIGKDWMLITAAKDNKVNTMTASWGGLGIMWNKNVAYIVVRPQRFNKEFLDASSTFSLTFFDESYRKDLSYLGTVSGRDEDKLSKTNLTVSYVDSTPTFEEAKLTIICKKLYAQEFKPECFIDNAIEKQCYPQKDYHTLYIAEVEKILIKQ